MAISSRSMKQTTKTVDDLEEKKQLPPSARCPISQSLLKNPVVLETGHTYEEQEIKKWLSIKNTCPLTGLELISKSYISNHALKNLIDEYKDFINEHQDVLIQLQKVHELQNQLKDEQQRNKRLSAARGWDHEQIAELESKLFNEQERNKSLEIELANTRSQLKQFVQNEPPLEAKQKNAFEQLQAGANPNEEYLKAVKNGKNAEARIWSALGADKDTKDEKTGETALMIAVKQNNKDIIKMLCEKEKVNVNLADNDGETALHYAVRQYNVWAIKFLISIGADAKIKNQFGKSSEMMGIENFGNCWFLWTKKQKDYSLFTPKKIETETEVEVNDSLLSFR